MASFKSFLFALFCLILFGGGIVFYVLFLENKNFLVHFAKTPTELNIPLSASKNVQPDEYSASPRFSASLELSQKLSLSPEEKSMISTAFRKIAEKIEESGLCHGGTHTLEPVFSYKNGAKSVNGQNFNASFSCRFSRDKLGQYNDLLQEVELINTNLGFFMIILPEAHPTLSASQKQHITYELRNDILKQAKDLEQDYTQSIGKPCEITKIDFFSHTPKHHTPQKHDKELQTLYAQTSLRC